MLGTTGGLWGTPDWITYHANGNGHLRIVSDAGVDRLFRQDDIQDVGGFLFFTGINYDSAPAANYRLFHYGNNGGAGQTGGINCRINSSAGNSTFSFAMHGYNNEGTDLNLESSVVTAGANHTIAVYLDWTATGDVTGTWYIDGVADTTATTTVTASRISLDAGTLRGLEVAGRSAQPPDNLLRNASLQGTQWHKYYFDASSKVVDDIARLHADHTAVLNTGQYASFNDHWANWLQNNTTASQSNFIDAQEAYLDAQSVSAGSLNDRWYEWLGDAGHTGSYQDRWHQYWTAQGI
jgi:hypothetical protein